MFAETLDTPNIRRCSYPEAEVLYFIYSSSWLQSRDSWTHREDGNYNVCRKVGYFKY